MLLNRPSPCTVCGTSEANVFQEVFRDRYSAMSGELEDRPWGTFLMQKLWEEWSGGRHADLCIHTAEDKLYAHRVILAAASPYFRALFSANMEECKTQTLRLSAVSTADMTSVLQYIYSGRIVLTEESAMKIMDLAEYFQIHALKKLSCCFLKSHLSHSNCLKVYEAALLHQCYDLANDAVQLVFSSCSQIFRDASFCHLTPEMLLLIVKQRVLSVESEDEVFKAILSWVHYDSEQRHQFLPLLLQHVNVNGLSPAMKAVCHDEYEDSCGSCCASDISPSQDRDQRYWDKQELLIVLGGESSGSYIPNVECLSLGSSWRCSIPRRCQVRVGGEHHEGKDVIPRMKNPRIYAAIATRNNCLYVIGGQTKESFSSWCEMYRVETNTWLEFTSLPKAVHGSGAVFVEELLYCVGGKGEEKHEAITLVYDSESEVWHHRSPMKTPRSHFGLGVLHGYIYAVGGMTPSDAPGRRSRPTALCEKYDPALDLWLPIASMSHPRGYLGIAVIHGFLYAIGGYNVDCWLSLVERYDPFLDQWVTVSPMLNPRSSFGVTVCSERIYCLGGFDGDTILNTVEKYNPRTDMWHCVQSMQLRRYALVAATVFIPGTPVKDLSQPLSSEHSQSE